MRIALLTDIHANREALSACLAHARRSNAERYVFLGDLVGYGADPGWVIDTVMAYVGRGARAVLGNHDAAVVQGPGTHMHADARKVIEWTRLQLGNEQLNFIGSLPLQIEDDGRLFVHANAWDPGQWEYITGAYEARRSMLATHCSHTFCGHVHEPALYHMAANGRVSKFTPQAGTGIPLGPQRRWLAIPGTVGQPRDGVLAARYALFDDSGNTLTYFQVPYDHEVAARKVRAAGLPHSLVMRPEAVR